MNDVTKLANHLESHDMAWCDAVNDPATGTLIIKALRYYAAHDPATEHTCELTEALAWLRAQPFSGFSSTADGFVRAWTHNGATLFDPCKPDMEVGENVERVAISE